MKSQNRKKILRAERKLVTLMGETYLWGRWYDIFNLSGGKYF